MAESAHESYPIDRQLPSGPAVHAALGGLVIVLATFASYGPALRGDLIWDDDAYVSENVLLTMPGGLWKIWTRPRETPQYYPLVFTSYWLEARLWGLSTFGLHSVNVALHAASALLLWCVLFRLGIPGAWLAGAIFALHPVHVESVAWITERKNVLSCVFYLLALLAWLSFHRSRVWTSYALSLVLFLGALLSKTVTCSLPVAILIVHWWRRDPIDRRLLTALTPYFVLGLALGLFTAYLEKSHVGAEGDEWSLSLVERGLVAGRALWFYAGKLVWPANLVFNYPRWKIDQAAVWQYLFPLAFVVAVAVLWGLRNRIGRGAFAAVACFALTLVPALGFFDVYPFRYSFVADHFQYHASMGLIALAAALVSRGWRRAFQSQIATGKGRFRIWSAAILVALGFLTYRQCLIYGDVETLWRRTIAANPESWLARFNLAGLLLRRGDEAEAVEQYQRVLEINPRCADAHWNLGNIAGTHGRHEEAMAQYRAALAIAPSEPTAHYNMAKELERVGDTEGAIAAYEECLKHDPTYWAAHVNVGLLLLNRGQDRVAWAHFGEALRYHPNNAAALHNLGMILEREGKHEAAIDYYVRALAQDPDLLSAWYRLSVCWRAIGGAEQSEAALRKTLELDPDHLEAIADLAALDFERGHIDLAVTGYRRVLEVNPSDAQIRHNLSAALERLGKAADAAAVLRAGLERDPTNIALKHDLAKLLATSADPSVRNGPEAVSLAEEVVRRLDPPPPEALATLADAYAEVRMFAKAVETMDRAIELARSQARDSLVQALISRRSRYAAAAGS